MAEQTATGVGRRAVLRCAAVCGAGAPLLAACGSDGEVSTGASPSDGASSASPSVKASAGSKGGSAKGLVAVADVPVGGGVILEEPKVVVTQPSKGQIKAFSSICTHQGCPVGSVENGIIICPCHGSQFSAEDGSVVKEPASAPLAAVKVTVKDGQVIES